MSVSVGIIGFGRIAKIHADIFCRLGCTIKSILIQDCSKRTEIHNFFKDRELITYPEIYTDKYEFFGSAISHVIVACPPEHHFMYLTDAFDRQLPVFCEKPLVLEPNVKSEDHFPHALQLRKHPNVNFLVNTSNALFVPKLCELLGEPVIESFKFEFHTNGSYKWSDISADLLPHAVSLLVVACGSDGVLHEPKYKIYEHSNEINFFYSDVQIAFKFKQGPHIAKKMSIWINDIKFERETMGHSDSYRLAFKCQKLANIIEFDDPFVTYAKRFIQGERNMALDFKVQEICSLLLNSYVD